MAAADPEVVRTATGRFEARAVPRAMNPALRSSSTTVVSIAGFLSSASASGVEREPGQITALLIPLRASSSQREEQRAVFGFVGSITLNGRAENVQSAAVGLRV